MRIRCAAIVAGLALGLMSGAAQAASIIYDVDFAVNGQPVSGTIETDGQLGALAAKNILSYSIDVLDFNFSSTNSSLYIKGSDLSATKDNLSFLFQNNEGDEVQIQSSNPRYYIEFETRPENYIQYQVPANTDNQFFDTGTTVSIATAAPLSSVPLPASAPMFGASLLALGAIGYGVKRKKAAATA